MSESRLWQEVFFGTFTCQWCGVRWAGRWNGPKELITCLACKKRLYDDEGKLIEPEDE